MALSSPRMALADALHRPLHQHWQTYLAEGIMLILLGMAAMLLPVLAGIAVTIFLGWLFLVAGIAGLVFTFRAKGAPGQIWSFLSALVALLAGAVLVWHPLGGMITLTYVMVGFFIFDGVFIILMALEHRRELASRWEWMLANGVLDLVLAAIVISGMPSTLGWALGLIVGIDMIFGGASLSAMAIEARKPTAA